MKQKIHNAKLLIKDKKIKYDGDNTWAVEGEFVRIYKKPGRDILSYKNAKDIKIEIVPEVMINELEDIKFFK